jgi:DNA-binding response OmpR family regulator
MMDNVIYIADTDLANCKATQNFFEKEGLRVEYFESGDHLFNAFQEKKCALAILGTATQGSDSFIVGAKIRQTSEIPVVMLAAQESDESYIFSMSLGMDAYLVKPLAPAKLVTHARALLIRAELRNTMFTPVVKKETGFVMKYGDVSICPDKLTAYCNEQELKLTTTEFKLLVFMFENQDRVIVRDEFLRALWSNSSVKLRAVDDVIKRLRRKLSELSSQVSIETVWGYGFKLGERLGPVSKAS